MIEANLQPLLNIRFIASEHSTGKTHGGRIDSLGFDENHCPVILEYKRLVGENVINQGLFYLDWLLDHKAEFKLLVLDSLLLYLHVDPATALPVLANARDVTNIGHWGTGNLEVILTSQADLDAVKPFIMAAYQGRAISVS